MRKGIMTGRYFLICAMLAVLLVGVCCAGGAFAAPIDLDDLVDQTPAAADVNEPTDETPAATPAPVVTGEEAAITINYWVEGADIAGDPGDPAVEADALENYTLYSQEERQAAVGTTVKLTADDVSEYLYTPELGRRFASFLSSSEAVVAADGTTAIDVYYARGVFTYEFDIVNDQATMTISGTTYKGGADDKYTVSGKYEQRVVIPGVENGLMPVPGASQGDVFCAGWALDERTGIKDVMTYAKTITEEMLPTDDMPYDDLTFTLKALWYNAAQQSILACWYEQSPDEAAHEGLNRMTYNGKTYVNYPATNFEITLPKGASPSASSVPGLVLRARIDPDTTKEGDEGRTWQFIYDRERFDITFNTGGAGTIEPGRGMMYQQNLYRFDPGWREGTTRTDGSTTYTFAGWYTDDGEFAGYSLTNLYMPAKNIRLNARWEK